MESDMKKYLHKRVLFEKLMLFFFKKKQAILLDDAVTPQPRWGYGKPPHPKLYEIINKNRGIYKNYLAQFLKYKDFLARIPAEKAGSDPTIPAWINGMLPPLDAVALYGFLSLNNPKRYFEIGSGNSTKFAKQAIRDHGLRTKITSFDPQPRADIDSICDNAIRRPVEDVDVAIFEELEAGDILFVDNSHRVFTNSDATVVFLDILPRLKEGVYVEFHDISLPFDYSPEIAARYYSEQYLLAAYLLAEGDKFDILLPNEFITRDPELNDVMLPLWKSLKMEEAGTQGISFWIKKSG